MQKKALWLAGPGKRWTAHAHASDRSKRAKATKVCRSARCLVPWIPLSGAERRALQDAPDARAMLSSPCGCAFVCVAARQRTRWANKEEQKMIRRAKEGITKLLAAPQPYRDRGMVLASQLLEVLDNKAEVVH